VPLSSSTHSRFGATYDRREEPAMPSATPAPAELELFGQPRLLRGGMAVHLGARKAMALLAFLALEGVSHRERLAALLWPDVDASAGRRNLRRELFRLRELGCALHEGADGALALDPRLSIDVQNFRAALQGGDDVGALTIARERVLDGLDGVAGAEVDGWLDRWRQQLLQQRQAARLRHAAALEAGGEMAAALAQHLQALAEDRCAEPVVRAAMRLHAALGERAAALALFAQFTQALQDELGLAPDSHTQALARELRAPGDAGLPLPGPAFPRQLPSAPLLADRLPFVGRAAMRTQIADAWAAGQRVYLSGVAGAGKTRLATECLASQGAWLRVVCTQDDAEQHYASAVRALRALQEAATDVVLPDWVRRELAAVLPELGEAPVPLANAEAAERLRTAFATAWRLLVRDNFNALLLDDWQWGDPASVDLWNRLDDAQTPVHWIVAFRSAQLPLAALQRLRQDVDGGRAVVMELKGLDADESLALVRALSRSAGGRLFAQRLQRSTEGNPFFLIETLRHLFELGQLRVETDGSWSTPFDDRTHDYAELPVPASVRDAVLGRVRALGDGARRLLEAASLAGDSFDPGLLDGVTPLAPKTMVAIFEHAQAARLLAPADEGYRFAHDLVRQCLAESLSPARRRLLHHALAARLTQRAAAPAIVAQHLERAGQASEAVAWRLRAAESAWRVHALSDSRFQYEQALADGAAGARAVAIHLALVRLHQRSADRAGVTAALAAALAASLDTDAETRLEVHLECIEDQVLSDRTDEAQALLVALEGDLATALPRQRARATRMQARIAQWRGRHEDAATLRRSAIALLEGQPDALSEMADIFDEASRAAARHGDMPQAESLARRAIAGFEATGNLPSLSQSLTMLGVAILYGRGDRKASEAAFERARALAARCGHVPAQRAAILNLVKLHTDVGRADAALALIQEGDALASGFEHQRAEQAFAQARYFVHYLRGEVAAADAAAQHLLAVARRVADRGVLVDSLQMVVDLYLHTGRHAQAERLLDEAEAQGARPDSEGRDLQSATTSAKRAWCLLQVGDVPAALRQMAKVGKPAREEDRWLIGWIGAAVALAAGQPGAASRWLSGLDIGAEVATDALAMVLVQRLRLQPTDAEARERALALLAAGVLPALEAAQLRGALG
jgi:DNA-binding SARP family transcriptional activator